MSEEKVSYFIEAKSENERPYDISMCNAPDCTRKCLRKNFKALTERYVSVADFQNSCIEYSKPEK